MRQAALQLKTRIENVNIMNNNIEIQSVILKVMLSLIAMLALWYVLILGNMVFNIVERNALEKRAVSLSNEVGDLELSYLSISKDVDISMSASMGFKEAKVIFATRKSLGTLKLAHNEI